MNVTRTLPWAADWVARTRQRAFRTSPADRDPVILHHSRIYILPTRRGSMLMLTLGVMLIASLNYSLSLGLGVTFFVSGLIAAALLNTFRNLAVQADYSGQTFKHILAPVWLLSYTYGTRAFQCAMNGVTGTIRGEYPKSPWKVALLVIVVLIIVVIAMSLPGR